MDFDGRGSVGLYPECLETIRYKTTSDRQETRDAPDLVDLEPYPSRSDCGKHPNSWRKRSSPGAQFPFISPPQRVLMRILCMRGWLVSNWTVAVARTARISTCGTGYCYCVTALAYHTSSGSIGRQCRSYSYAVAEALRGILCSQIAVNGAWSFGRIITES
ncbi:hypothetical protein BV20DRAFT_559664 [Pilatotrama ljubarskyi]|nr:hypothetical protein BV20DRAFT_559664 [Pilatotrama ljubarskyi]